MSTYIKETKNPLTGEWQEAIWMDDHFGKHLYGVSFKNADGTQSVFDPREYDLETREHTDDGKTIETKEHKSGRKDVTIGVQMVDVKADDEATAKAKEHIEDEVIPELANRDVLVVVIHKETNEHAERIVKAPNVRKYAEAVVKAHLDANPNAKPDYVLVEHHISNNTVTVSTL